MLMLLKDTLKIFIIFIACTLLFYFGLRAIHAEYQEFHRYDPPEGKAVKVVNSGEQKQDWIDRFSIFLRLGE